MLTASENQAQNAQAGTQNRWVASPGQGRWAGTIQEPQGSEVRVTLPSNTRLLQLPLFSTHKLEFFRKEQPAGSRQGPQHALLISAGNTAGYEVMLSRDQRRVTELARRFSGQHTVVLI